MSALRPHGFNMRCRLFALTAVTASGVAAGCDSEREGETPADASFGEPIVYRRDAGADGSTPFDAAVDSGPNARLRFVHAFPNIAALTACHDPDGRAGAEAPYPLRQDSQLLRADFGFISPELALPQLASGELTLHRELIRDAGAADAGSSDGGSAEPCSELSREAVIPLPVPEDWLAQLKLRSSSAGFLPQFVSSVGGARPITLIGTGLALNDAAVESDRDGGLASAFGARALLQAEVEPENGSTFALSLLHAIPNITGLDAGVYGESAAVRVCVTEGTLVNPVIPQAPNSPGFPFRVRAPLGTSFNPRTPYTFRVFVQSDFDSEKKTCATTGLRALAEATFPQGRFEAGRSYTLALIGAVSPAELCSASRTTFVRPGGCPRPVDTLSPRLVALQESAR